MDFETKQAKSRSLVKEFGAYKIRASCPTGYLLTGCQCHSSSVECEGAEVRKGMCYVSSRAGDGAGQKGVLPQA